MGLFDRVRRSPGPARVIEDALFGPLEYSDTGCWRGDVFFGPAGDDIGVELTSEGREPTEEQRQTFVQLGERYASLSSAIGRSLLDLYAPKLKHSGEGLPSLRSPEELLAAVQLNWVEVSRGGELTLGYGFREGVGSEDAVFAVRIKDWKPSGKSLEL